MRVNWCHAREGAIVGFKCGNDALNGLRDILYEGIQSDQVCVLHDVVQAWESRVQEDVFLNNFIVAEANATLRHDQYVKGELHKPH